MDYIEFGKYLRSLRKKRGLTLEELGEKAGGLSKSYLSNIENGRHGIPSPEVLRKISTPLGITSTELLVVAGYVKEDELKQAMEEFTDYDNELDKLIRKTLRKIMDGVKFGDWDFKEKLLQELKHFLQEFEIEIDEAILKFRKLKKGNIHQKLELTEILNSCKLTYNGQPLDEDDRKQVLDMLAVLFRDRKK